MKRLNPPSANLTKTAIDGLVSPKSGREEIRDTEVNGLVLRITSTGARSWCVFRRVKGGEPVRITLGNARDISPTVARIHAKKIVSDLALGIAPVKKKSVKAKADEARERKQHTLESLALAYVDFQKSRGRSSYSDALSIFTLHLIGRAPALANKHAADVEAGEISDLLRAVKEAGKDRTANKLRSYLAAAYSIALKAETSHEYPVKFKAFGVKRNPVAKTQADTSANQADKNPLYLPDLRAYWKIIETVPGADGAKLRTHLLTGGQRIEQLVKLRKVDVTADAITIHDSKGRGQVVRKHVVPLTARASADIQQLCNGGEWLFSKSGDKAVDATGLSRIAKKYVKSSIEGFQLKRIRSGVETLLAQRGVSEEIRGRLQSHGIAGVQSKHYNAHDYLPEKLAALQLLEAALTSTDAKVIAIRTAG